jgi:hypothetical protein
MRNFRTTGLLAAALLVSVGWGRALAPADAEVIDLGERRVTRYAVTEPDGISGEQTDPTVVGELARGQADELRLRVVGSPNEMRLSLGEARSVHQLLGHMLAMSATDPPPIDPPKDQEPAPTVEDPPVPPAAPSAPVSPAPPVSPALPDVTGADSSRAFLGMNLSDVAYYGRAWVFTDAMLLSDAWRKGGRGHIYKSGYAPPGQYLCTWSGSGSIRFSGDASSTSTSSNSALVTIKSGKQGVNMQKTGEVGNVSLIRSDHEMRQSAFHPVFLNRLKPFGTVRFMDWANTNNSSRTRWADRTLPGDRPQAGKNGVAIEHMIALSNELGADPWFCMPHKADDDYIRRFAEMARDRLRPDAKIYVEYSNEVWNTQFKQHDYIRGLGDGETFSDDFFDAWAQRARRTFAIWSEVFGDEADDRLVRVAAVHLQNPWIAKKLLPRLNGEFDAVAPSAYFGITRKQGKTLTARSSADDVLNLCEKNIRSDNLGWYERHGQLARDWSTKLGRPIRLVSYEAGQHLSANGDEQLAYYDALIAAQSHPRMYGLYLLNMRMFEKSGGDLFVAFNDVSKPGKFGSWGHLEYQDQPTADAPKYRALIEYPPIGAPPKAP